jgi:hypothetical protein
MILLPFFLRDRAVENVPIWLGGFGLTCHRRKGTEDRRPDVRLDLLTATPTS